MSDKIEKGISYYQKWTLIIVICLFLLLFGYKILFANISINIPDLSFPDLLTLVLSLFAIGISLAFYFMASSASNKFYDNTYKFTQDFGLMLGRIESSFGERLKYLGEMYSSINEKIENHPVINQTKKEIKIRESKAAEINRDTEKLVNEILEEAKIENPKKQEFINQLNTNVEELTKANKEIDKLKRRLQEIENPQKVNWRQFFIPPSLKQLIRFALVIPLGEKFIIENTPEEINRKFQEIGKDFSQKALLSYINYGILDDNLSLTENGINYLKALALE